MEESERDLLIKLDIKIAIMCKTLNELIIDNKKEHEKIFKLFEKADEKIDKKVSFALYKWITTVIITAILGIGIASTDLRITINEKISNINSRISSYHNNIIP